MIDPARDVVIPVSVWLGIQIIEGTAQRDIRERLELIQEFPRNRIDSARRDDVVEKRPSLSRKRINAQRIVDGIASAEIAAPHCTIGNQVPGSLGRLPAQTLVSGEEKRGPKWRASSQRSAELILAKDRLRQRRVVEKVARIEGLVTKELKDIPVKFLAAGSRHNIRNTPT